MCSLVSMSLVFLHNKNYRLSALLISIVGTLNATIMSMGFAVIIDFFIELYKKESNKNNVNIFNIFIRNIKDILIFGSCFLPFFITFISNYIHFGIINKQMAVGFQDTKFLLQRFISYLFDLNLGFFPYIPILFIIFIFLVLYGIKKLYSKSFVYIIGFILTVLTYSIMSHINCGISGIARYNSWTIPIIFFYVSLYYDYIILRVWVRKIIFALILVSSLYTMLYLCLLKKGGCLRTHFDWTPVAKKVMHYAPELYNPFRIIFIFRTLHGYDNKYWNKDQITKSPVVYKEDDSALVRKILVTNNVDIHQFKKKFLGNKNSMNFLVNQFNNKKLHKSIFYLNFPRSIKIYCNSPIYYLDLLL